MKFENIHTRKLTAEDAHLFPESLELLNRTQGRDLFPKDYLNARTSDPNSYVVVALTEQSVVGVGVAQIINEYSFYVPFDPHIVSKLSGKKVGSFSTLCVQENLQGKGIGKQLSHMRMDWLLSKGCDVIVGVSWVSGKAHTSDRVFEKMGFQIVERVEHFFVESSLERTFVCPTCGEPPCTCSAIMYMKIVSR